MPSSFRSRRVQASTTYGLSIPPTKLAVSYKQYGIGLPGMFTPTPRLSTFGLKALAGPFPRVKFCPTGGITLANAPDFLVLPNVCCVGGSWITPAASIRASDWAAITRLALQAQRLRG